ncbi:hypothetical protein [Parapedobacter tibetensis]|uniref:hypothetical protein n=1 Tax=Parapedobacter tibetensis TaxID=2972951 RepID=UPI00214DD63C|nr:hypothetical protein [Parapedobacter tibetensis]
MLRISGLPVIVTVILLYVGVSVRGQSLRYANETEIGTLWSGANFFSPVALTVQSFNGVQFARVMSMGLTVGVDEYFGLRIVPITLGARVILPKKRVSPYVGMEVGYGFAWFEKRTDTQWHDGGVVFNPSMGLRWKAKGKDRYLVSIGYKRQVASLHTANTILGPEAYNTEKYTLNRMAIRFGVVF